MGMFNNEYGAVFSFVDSLEIMLENGYPKVPPVVQDILTQELTHLATSSASMKLIQDYIRGEISEEVFVSSMATLRRP